MTDFPQENYVAQYGWCFFQCCNVKLYSFYRIIHTFIKIFNYKISRLIHMFWRPTLRLAVSFGHPSACILKIYFLLSGVYMSASIWMGCCIWCFCQTAGLVSSYSHQYWQEAVLSTPLNRYSASGKGSPFTLFNTTNKNVENPISSTSRVPYNHFFCFQYIFHWKKWLHGELMMNSRLVKPTSVRIQLRMVKNDLMLYIIIAIVIQQIWRDFELHMVLVVDKHKRVGYKREI